MCVLGDPFERASEIRVPLYPMQIHAIIPWYKFSMQILVDFLQEASNGSEIAGHVEVVLERSISGFLHLRMGKAVTGVKIRTI